MNLVWFKITDLRIKDHEPLKKAFAKSDKVLPIFCLDPSFYQSMKFGHQKFSKFKLKFLYQSIIDLANTFKKYNSHLNIYMDSP